MFSSMARALGALLLAGAAVGAAAADYPARAVKLVVPYPAGGSSDALARLIANSLVKAWGQPVVVENKAGAGGNIGMAYAAQAAGDGYTIVLTTNAIVTSEEFYPKKGYEPESLAALGMVASQPQVLVAQASLGIDSVPRLVAYAKAHPGKLSYASCGAGTPQHLAMELFKSATGTSMVHIPYKGCAPVTADFIAGSVQVAVMNQTSLAPLGANAKPLAVTTARPSALAPGLPTLQSLGFKNFDVGIWFGLMVPASTPADIRQKITADVARVLEDKDIAAQMTRLGMDRWVTSPAEMNATIASDRKVIRQLIEQKKLVPEAS